MKRILVLSLLLLAPFALAEEKPAISLGSPDSHLGGLSESLVREAQAAMDRSIGWLAKTQTEDGHWSNKGFPALTALPVWALERAGWENKEALNKAVAYLTSCAREDGSIMVPPGPDRRGGGLPNYNTSLSMIALHATGRPEIVPIVLKARTYMAKAQNLEGDSALRGGMGYDAKTGTTKTDLSNTFMAFEAMRITETLEDLRTEKSQRADLDWKAAVQFLEKMQNNPKVNKQPWVSTDPKDQGGFVYSPDSGRGNEYTDDEGVVRFRSFGAMSYAGLLSYIYADVDKEDPRVSATFDWAVRHWTLDENPGSGKEGLFYYLNVLSKGMRAYGQENIYPEKGQPFKWREQVIKKLLSTQKIDTDGTGYWLNESSRYWETDKVLVTAYGLLTLEYALGL